MRGGRRRRTGKAGSAAAARWARPAHRVCRVAARRTGVSEDRFIAPGATLGVMGGGQLGRMFVHAAQAMGYFTAVLDADPASPAGLVAHEHLRAAYLDPEALDRLAETSAAITTEFENVPAAALDALAQRRPVCPAAA